MSAGKGDSPRPVDGEKYRSNYDKIFKRDPQKSQKINSSSEDRSPTILEEIKFKVIFNENKD
jgi:hypothetical protein